MPRRSSVTLAELEERMRPGAWSEVGFLGREERLEDVLAADAQTLAELGLTARQLAEPLEWLMQACFVPETPFDRIAPAENKAGKARLRREVERRFGPVHELETGTRVGGRYDVEVEGTLGVQECPWSSESIEEAMLRDRPFDVCGGGSFDWRIRNLTNGVEVSGPQLIAHLIGTHGFFEGFESPYRVDPRALAQLLELGPYRA